MPEQPTDAELVARGMAVVRPMIEDSTRKQERRKRAGRAWDSYDRQLREKMFDDPLLRQGRTRNPLLPMVYMDGYLQGEQTATQDVYDAIGEAMVSTTSNGDYVLDKARLDALYDALRARGATHGHR